MMLEEIPIAPFAAPACARAPGTGQHGPGGGRYAEPEPRSEIQGFHIWMADSARRREAASILIRKMYGWRGYAIEPSLFQEASKITLYAETGGAVFATMSLCLDSPILLPADENFRDVLDRLRAAGRRLCEPSRLAIDKGVTKRVFAALIHTSYLYARVVHRCSDYVIEVNRGCVEQHGEERSFYPYFFPASDEPGITGRLRAGLD